MIGLGRGFILAVPVLGLAVLAPPAGAASDRGETGYVDEAEYVVSIRLAMGEEGRIEDGNDPLEPLNRAVFNLNEVFQTWFLRPFSEFYEAFVPPPVREGVGNMIDNVATPVILANDLLQGEGERAVITVQRFVINTTYGIGGFVDRATEMGIEGHDEDFGQTLAVWGVGEGFYLVLPLFGPSNPRDAVGDLLVDGYFDPLGRWLVNSNRDAVRWSRAGVGALDEYGGVMDELAQIQKTSIDYYAAIRSMYRQKRAAEIGNGEDIDLPPIPDLSYEIESLAPDSLAIGPD